MSAAAALADVTQKFHLPQDLYSYQREDGDRVADTDRNWLLTHEMGVGKTAIAIWAVEKAGYKFPLIICPNSIRYIWATQVKEWTGLNSAVSGSYYTTGGKMGDIIRSIFYDHHKKYKIVNYETLRLDHASELLKLIPWDVVIFDEVHKLRNADPRKVKKLMTATWSFLDTLDPKTKILGLSGSPIMNYPNDLYGPLSACFPDQYPRNAQALRRFLYKYTLYSSGRFGTYAYGSYNLRQLKDETKDLQIRRLKSEVLSYLPDKYYQRPELEMQADQRKLYDQMETELKVLVDTGEPLWSPTVLSTLTRLRQINLDPEIIGITTASSAKTEYLMDLVESTDEKLVIFSCFEKYIEILDKKFGEWGLPRVVVTGQVPPDRRMEAVRRFQEDPNIRLFLGTIQTAGEGITLTAASTVVLMDRWWNEPTNQQAIDRLHRIGQKNAVQVILPVVQKSIDAHVDAILQQKHEASQAYYQENEVRDFIFGSIRTGGIL